MAVLTDQDRQALWADFMDALSRLKEPINLSKSDLRAAVNAIDQWIDDNAVSFNSAIPEPARSNLTAIQKARLLCLVTKRRWEVS